MDTIFAFIHQYYILLIAITLYGMLITSYISIKLDKIKLEDRINRLDSYANADHRTLVAVQKDVREIKKAVPKTITVKKKKSDSPSPLDDTIQENSTPGIPWEDRLDSDRVT